MKKLFSTIKMIIFLVGCTLLFVACNVPEDLNVELAKQYKVGDKVTIGGDEFYVYRVGTESVSLFAAYNINRTSYQGIDACIEAYEKKLEDAGVKIEYIGLLSYSDLDDLSGNKHSECISGLPYLCDNAPDFIKTESDYWLGGYNKYDTYTWLYKNGMIDQEQFEDKEYGFRPVIRVLTSEIKE